MFYGSEMGFGGDGRPPSPNYYGTGADGDTVISSNTDWATSTGENDTGVVVKNFKSLIINAGVTVKPAHRARVMMIYCSGHCTINGHLHIDKLGASGAIGSDTQFFRYKLGESSSGSAATPLNSADTLGGGTGIKKYVVPTAGGAGGAKQPANSNGNAGSCLLYTSPSPRDRG